jgi:hypothetical protein
VVVTGAFMLVACVVIAGFSEDGVLVKGKFFCVEQWRAERLLARECRNTRLRGKARSEYQFPRPYSITLLVSLFCCCCAFNDPLFSPSIISLAVFHAVNLAIQLNFVEDPEVGSVRFKIFMHRSA